MLLFIIHKQTVVQRFHESSELKPVSFLKYVLSMPVACQHLKYFGDIRKLKHEFAPAIQD